MPQSQLKRLKASLRTAGVTGQQKSKKEKKRQANNSADSRLDKSEKLKGIREEFNPFELKTTREKHTILGQKRVKGKEGRPGLSKQIGEENRKRTLLVEMQRRNKAGGIVDRRFGENDASMPPEERMLERFAREKQKRTRGADIFNLEGDEDQLTHLGQSLGALRDDFDAGGIPSDESDNEGPTLLSRKRLLEAEENCLDGEEQEEGPERKKSKAEVMKEVVTKSKLFKYERQKAKEDDEKERETLDAQMGELWSLLGQKQPSATGTAGGITGTNAEPLGVRGSGAKEAEKEAKGDEYDQAVREMMFDARSKPAERTKTDEEKAAEESERLRKMEDARLRRMRGEEVSDDEEAEKAHEGDGDYEELGDAATYGLGSGIPAPRGQAMRDGNPEDYLDGDYEVSEDGYVDVDEEGLIAGDDGSVSEPEEDVEAGADLDEDEFLADVFPDKPKEAGKEVSGDRLAFTFPCPQSLPEMLTINSGIPVMDLPTVVQRIRVLHHPKLQEGNKEKLSRFAPVLLDFILHLSDIAPPVPFSALDTLIRHLHALAKSHPLPIAIRIRELLSTLQAPIKPADLILLTIAAIVFPTSDHFHQVTTPALILICQQLSPHVPQDSLQALTTGSYLATLSAQYVRISKRYVPEAMNFTLSALCLLSPTQPKSIPGHFPYHPRDDLRIPASSLSSESRKLSFHEIFSSRPDTPVAVLHTLVNLLLHLSKLWSDKSSFIEIFTPALSVLQHLRTHASLKSALKPAVASLTASLAAAARSRRPLELHHHRPLPIPSNIPKFEEDYNPNKVSYDPDESRRGAKKLAAEVKREKKGALRELRKDSAFISRHKMVADKKASKDYHAKMAKIVATIQTEEGTAANEYKRMKNKRK